MAAAARIVNPELPRTPAFFWVALLATLATGALILGGSVLLIRNWADLPDASALRTGQLMLLSVSLLGMAGLMGLLKPGARTTQLGFGAGALASVLFVSTAIDPFRPHMEGWEKWLAWLLATVSPMQFAVGYDFLSRFPRTIEERLPWRILRYALYVAALPLWLPRNVRGALRLLDPPVKLDWLEAIATSRPALFAAYGAVSGAVMVAVLVRNYRAMPTDQERRRMRFAAVALMPAFLALLWTSALRNGGQLLGVEDIARTDLYRWSAEAAVLLVLPCPLALAYSVLKHRLLEIRFVIRRGVQYLLARNFLRFLLLLPPLTLFVQLLLNPDAGLVEVFRRQSPSLSILVIAGAALSLKYRQALQDSIDKRFFRTAYSQEKILLELIEEIKEADTVNAISMLVANKIEAALQPKDLCILYRRDSVEGFTVGYPDDVQAGRALELLKEAEVLNTLDSGTVAPFTVSDVEPGVPIEHADYSLVVPLSGAEQKIVGVLWLGEKKSEEPYTPRDRDLLQAIAGQIAMVYQNLHLKEQLLEEQRVRINVISRLDREMNLLKECPRCGRCFDRGSELCAFDGSELTMLTPVERIIDKKYRLDRRLGGGGMGSVYEAVDLNLNRKVAVKVMMGKLFGNRAALRRFEREARASARLHHPNIVTIHDYGSLRGDGAYLVMEYLAGISWRSELSSRRMVPGRECAPWFDQLCRAMYAAHGAGIIHRDLKPENIMITRNDGALPHVTVVDFGLAKVREFEVHDATASSITATGVVMGTVRYMSPEQLSNTELDSRSDIYSAGLIAVETLFGGFPAKMREIEQWLDQSLVREAARHPNWDPQPLAETLKIALARDPAKRPSAVEWREALVPLLRRCPPFQPGDAQSWHGDTETLEP